MFLLELEQTMAFLCHHEEKNQQHSLFTYLIRAWQSTKIPGPENKIFRYLHIQIAFTELARTVMAGRHCCDYSEAWRQNELLLSVHFLLKRCFHNNSHNTDLLTHLWPKISVRTTQLSSWSCFSLWSAPCRLVMSGRGGNWRTACSLFWPLN